MKRLLRFSVLVMFLVSYQYRVVQAEQSDWLILPGVRAGNITSTMSENDVRSLLGAKNVQPTEVYVGEGTSLPGTIIFPDDPSKTLEILWKDKTRKILQEIRVSQSKTMWKTTNGITIGTALKAMEIKNKKPFSLSGFGWDYSGTVISTNGGALHEFDSGNLIVRLSPESMWQKAPEYSQVIGDLEYHSSNAAMQKFNPTIYQIIARFNGE